MKKEDNNHIQDLAYIRSMMESSSRFISLSGLSGVAAGIFALLGAGAVYLYLGIVPWGGKRWYHVEDINATKWGMDYLTFFILVASVVLLLSITVGWLMSYKKAKKAGQKLLTKSSGLLLMNFLVPLITGGIFCIILTYHEYFGMVAPSMLLFYGLALVNGSKYTLDDVRYLGITEIILGLLAAFFIRNGLLFWTIGFGVMHIVYGLRMYFKYDRK